MAVPRLGRVPGPRPGHQFAKDGFDDTAQEAWRPLSHSFTGVTGNTIGPSLLPGLLRQETFVECLNT